MERLQGNLLAAPFPDLCMHTPAASLRLAAQESARHTAAPSSFKPPKPRVGRHPRRRTPQVRSRGARDYVDAGVKSYRGVRMRSWGKWVSEIRQPKKRSRIWLGSYSTPEAAAQAYDMALYYLRGPLAAVNFPALIPREDPPPDLSPRDVQKAAIAAGVAADSIRSRSGTESNSCWMFNLQMNLSPAIEAAASSIHSAAQIDEDEATPLNLCTSTKLCDGALRQENDGHHRYQMSDQKIRYVFDFNLNEAAVPESSEEGNNFVQKESSLSSSLLSYAGDHGRPMFLCL